MWRWIHSLPRAVRQQFHGQGASAGLCVEDHHEKDQNEKELRKSEETEQKKKASCLWKFHCRRRDERKKSSNNGSGSGPNRCHDFWKFLHRPSIPLDAVGLGGVVAMGIQYHLDYFKHRKVARKTTTEQAYKHCLVPNVLRVFPSTINCMQPQQAGYHTAAHTRLPPTFLQPGEPPPPLAKGDTEPREKETLTTVFRDFQGICQTYTATGKGIMGSQAAETGDMSQAAKLWEEAGKLGNAKSKFNLAVCYERGTGVKKSLSEAVKLYSMAATDLHPQSMFNLGVMYIDGTSYTPQDSARGVDLITTAADLGLVEAQKYLGIYYTEDGTEDVKKAVKYLTLAANQHDMDCQYLLGMCYETGYGVTENTCKAADLYAKAAESGHTDAIYSLAVFHRDGIGGLPQDKLCADELFRKAADAGSKEAMEEIHKDQLVTMSLQQREKEAAPVIEVFEDGEREPEQNDAIQETDKDATYLFKLSSCASSPCLTDFLRTSIKQGTNRGPLYDPVSKQGTISQLYLQIMSPRGITDAPLFTRRVRNTSLCESETSSDSGVEFRVGLDDEVDSDLGSCSPITRTQTMPDLSTLSCN